MHRKENHTVLGAQNGNCKYEDASCWFSHDVRNQSDNAETTADQQEGTQSIFEIMEKITERLVELEKSNTTKKLNNNTYSKNNKFMKSECLNTIKRE